MAFSVSTTVCSGTRRRSDVCPFSSSHVRNELMPDAKLLMLRGVNPALVIIITQSFNRCGVISHVHPANRANAFHASRYDLMVFAVHLSRIYFSRRKREKRSEKLLLVTQTLPCFGCGVR